jgi:uncharacterized protein
MAYEDLIGLLRCPADRSGLKHYQDRVLVCRACGRAYPIRDGVPVMLLDEKVQAEGKVLVEEAEAAGIAPKEEADEPTEKPDGEDAS